MSIIETFLRSWGEPMLYVAFFGTLVVLGFAETRHALLARGAQRLWRWPTNWALTALNIAVTSAVPLTALVAADYARDHDLGLLNLLDASAVVAAVATVLAFSLQSWAVHLLMHKVPLLWRLHRVHHTDVFLDISTTVRFHPAELLLQAPISAGVAVAVGASPAAVIAYGLLDAAINVFSHANIRLPEKADAVLSRIIVTPHLHRVHHSTRPRETDSNFGATLPVWDILFGTWRRKSPEDLERQGIGLDEMQDDRAYSLWWALTLPVRSIRRTPPREAPTDERPDRSPL